jgi:hypothetical protein
MRFALCLISLATGTGAITAAEKKERIWPTSIAPGAITSQQAAAAVQKLAGGRVKLVWMHAETRTADGKPIRSQGPDNRAAKGRVIKGLDTAEGTQRTIMDDTAQKIINARITHDGNRVLWADQTDPAGVTWVINWDGSGQRQVCPGTVLCLRYDAATKRELAYVWRPVTEKKGHHDLVVKSASLWAVPIDEPEAAKQVLAKPMLSDWRGFSVSADGKWGGGVLEDPKIGLVNLETGASLSFTSGCYANVAPDNSYRLWHFEGGHRGIRVFDYGATDDKDKKKVRGVYVGEIPTTTVDPAVTGKIDGYGFLHPKWSCNHARFMVMTGPHRNAKQADGSTQGLPQHIELYFGRFNETFTAMEGWAQVTSDMANCFWPDAWIESSDAPQQMEPSPAGASLLTGDAWPVDTAGTAFVYERLDSPRNTAGTATCAVVLRDRAFYGRGGSLDLAGGSVEPDADSITRLLAGATKNKHVTAELIVVPAAVPGAGTVLRLGTHRLAQEQDQLVLVTAAGATPLAKLKSGVPVVVQLVLGTNSTAFVDGREVRGMPKVEGFAAPVSFGGDGWAGEVQAVHLAGTHRTSVHCLASHTRMRAMADRRPAAKPIVVEAELVEHMQPNLAQMNSYRAHLSGNVYAVKRVVSGTLNEPRIVVMQFDVLDLKPVVRDLTVGKTYTLTVEAWDDRSEVHTATLQDDTHPELTRFLDPTR